MNNCSMWGLLILFFNKQNYDEIKNKLEIINSYRTTYPVYNEFTGWSHFRVKRLSCTFSIVKFLGGFGNTAVKEM